MHCHERSSQKTPLLTYKAMEILQVSLIIYVSWSAESTENWYADGLISFEESFSGLEE